MRSLKLLLNALIVTALSAVSLNALASKIDSVATEKSKTTSSGGTEKKSGNSWESPTK